VGNGLTRGGRGGNVPLVPLFGGVGEKKRGTWNRKNGPEDTNLEEISKKGGKNPPQPKKKTQKPHRGGLGPTQKNVGGERGEDLPGAGRAEKKGVRQCSERVPGRKNSLTKRPRRLPEYGKPRNPKAPEKKEKPFVGSP